MASSALKRSGRLFSDRRTVFLSRRSVCLAMDRRYDTHVEHLVLNGHMPPIIIRHCRISRLPAEGMVSDHSRPACVAGNPQPAVGRTRTTIGKRDAETCRDIR